MTIQGGQIITDGTATFIVDDIRDGHRVGNIILDHVLRQGYVKANGAVLQAADYPRLVQFVIDNNLSVTETEWQASMSGMYVYDDTAKTLRVPDLRGRFSQAADSDIGNVIEAGLPNITGNINMHSWSVQAASGAFYVSSWGSHNPPQPDGGGYGYANFAASRSSAIYGKSNTVQPAAIKLIAQIKY